MPTHVALLRAVNLGPHNKVSMAALCKMCEALDLTGARSLLQSGNVVFGAEGRSGAELEKLLESAAKKRLGLDTAFFVRTAAEWQTILTKNPFPKEAEADPAHLVVYVTKDPVPAKAAAALQGAIAGRERVATGKGRHAYLFYPDGIGTSRVTNTVIEKNLGTPGTGRNWNTARKIGALLEG